MTLKTTRDKSASFLKSIFFEQLAEHVFIFELLQEAWSRYNKMAEVSRSEVDTSGYDLLLECNGVIRHVELKTSGTDARRSFQNINMVLVDCGVRLWGHPLKGTCQEKRVVRK
jgi:hypothetical protein